MASKTAIEKDRTAVVIMDFQSFIVANYASDPEAVVRNAARVLDGARKAGIPVVYIMAGQLVDNGTEGSELHPGIAPQPGEKVIRKSKFGSFSTTDLDVHLREKGRDAIVLMGVSTSGCVLSTLRWGADINYKVLVVADGCDDKDPEVHRVLTEKVFPMQATVLKADDFLQAVA
jgi:nicotinamidase-related amidase